MKIEINDNVQLLSPKEVAEQLLNGTLEDGEYIGDVRLECGCDLEVDIHLRDEMDKRIDGYRDRTETFTLGDIRDTFTAADYYAWVKDESGDDVLACFGC